VANRRKGKELAQGADGLEEKVIEINPLLDERRLGTGKYVQAGNRYGNRRATRSFVGMQVVWEV